MMRQEKLKKELQAAAAEIQTETGFRVSVETAAELTAQPGKIIYHNPDTWSVVLHPAAFWPKASDAFKREEGYAREQYLLHYIRAHIRLDALAAGAEPSGYLEGLAFLSHIFRKEKDGVIALTPPRQCGKKYPGGAGVQPDDLYCDCVALKKTLVGLERRNTAAYILNKWNQRKEEAEVFCMLPEIVPAKDGVPHRLVPHFAAQWLPFFSGRANLAECYPVFRAPADIKGKVPDIFSPAELFLQKKGAFYGAFALRLIAGGWVSEAEPLAQDEKVPAYLSAHREEIRDAAGVYMETYFRYVCAADGFPSRLLRDNRIGADRTCAEINRLLRRIGASSDVGGAHPLGYF